MIWRRSICVFCADPTKIHAQLGVSDLKYNLTIFDNAGASVRNAGIVYAL